MLVGQAYIMLRTKEQKEAQNSSRRKKHTSRIAIYEQVVANECLMNDCFNEGPTFPTECF